MFHFSSQHNTGSGFGNLSFQNTFVVLVVEQFHIPGSAIIQTIFK